MATKWTRLPSRNECGAKQLVLSHGDSTITVADCYDGSRTCTLRGPEGVSEHKSVSDAEEAFEARTHTQVEGY